MKSIAYSIVSATSLVLGCFAPSYVDRCAMTAIGVMAFYLLIQQEAQP